MSNIALTENCPVSGLSLKQELNAYSKVSNKRTVLNNRTGGDIILQKVESQLGPWAFQEINKRTLYVY